MQTTDWQFAARFAACPEARPPRSKVPLRRFQAGSAGLVMAVVGGAAVTPLTAAVADGVSLRAAFATVPTACFLL